MCCVGVVEFMYKMGGEGLLSKKIASLTQGRPLGSFKFRGANRNKTVFQSKIYVQVADGFHDIVRSVCEFSDVVTVG